MEWSARRNSLKFASGKWPAGITCALAIAFRIVDSARRRFIDSGKFERMRSLTCPVIRSRCVTSSGGFRDSYERCISSHSRFVQMTALGEKYRVTIFGSKRVSATRSVRSVSSGRAPGKAAFTTCTFSRRAAKTRCSWRGNSFSGLSYMPYVSEAPRQRTMGFAVVTSGPRYPSESIRYFPSTADAMPCRPRASYRYVCGATYRIASGGMPRCVHSSTRAQHSHEPTKMSTQIVARRSRLRRTEAGIKRSKPEVNEALRLRCRKNAAVA
jgi:hypothetical protein